MTPERVVPVIVEPDTSRLALDEIGSLIRAAHSSVESEVVATIQHMSGALRHALRAGELLLVARTRVEPGHWHRWVAENARFDERTAKKYQRIAHYRELVLQWMAEGGSGQIEDAIRELRGLPAFVAGVTAAPATVGPERRERARRYLDEGYTYHQTAKLVGCDYTTVRAWFDLEYRRRRVAQDTQRRSRAKKAIRAAEQTAREALVTDTGGPSAEAYKSLQETAVLLNRMLDEAREPEAVKLIRSAQSHIRKAANEIGRAVSPRKKRSRTP